LSAKTWTVGRRPSSQSLERSAGTPEPADPATYYCVTPGETRPEYFRYNPAGIGDAMARAKWLSGPTQRELATHPDGLTGPAVRDKVFRRYREGREIWAAASGTPDPGDGPPLDLHLRAM
jgi:hypothetical protein